MPTNIFEQFDEIYSHWNILDKVGEGDAAGEDVAAGVCGLSLPPSGEPEQGLSDSQ